jgi:ketol-acid reductoisomerase
MDQRSDPRFVQETEADLSVLEGRRIAIVGYGNLGRSLSLNLRDSGAGPLVIGELPGPAWDAARADGFIVESAAAAAASDVVFILLPDELAPGIYQEELLPALQPGSALVFASGFNLAFQRIRPAPSLDVLLLAPRMLGAAIRALYQNGLGFPSFVSLEQDATGRGWPLLCALAKAIGSLRAGAMEISAAQEAYLDLFVEQTVGPDLAGALLSAFQVGVEAGLPPEALVLELYMSGEMGRSIHAMAEEGFFQQVKLHGFTAAYGGMVRFMALDRESRQQGYRQVLKEIQNGAFANALELEAESGFPSRRLLEELLEGDNPISRAEQRVRRKIRLPETGFGS